ncbi:MAG: hypothetical protein P8P83_03615 [Rickettsiaceae bacterium]|nr:hypothetical protein [Rickettsiaceae bacterium]
MKPKKLGERGATTSLLKINLLYMNNIEIKYSNFDFSKDSFISAQNIAEDASNKIIDEINSKNPLYKIFSNKHALDQARESEHHAKHIKENFSDLIVIGMGGSALNPETLTTLITPKKSTTRIHFLNNTDPFFLQDLVSKIELASCAVLAISNSGQTLETTSLVGVMISQFEQAGISNLGKHFYFVTNLNSGNLKNVATKIGATLIEHTPNISGRYSGLTNVSSLVAQVANIDIQEYLAGAELALQEFFSKKQESQPTIAAAAIYSAEKPITVNIGYLQKLNVFLEWYSQIIAESLGKNGAGITPIRGLGPNDQHSILQLYLDGPKDKIYSLFYTKNDHPIIKTSPLEEFDYIANKNLHDINKANFDATLCALNTTGAPTRSIILNDFSAKNIGSLVMHSMLEVVILGHMMKINPFNQPGVELIKTESTRLVQNL